MSLAVTDSHALIWYAMGPAQKLGCRARAFFDRAERGQATIYVPVLVLVEVSEAIRSGHVPLTSDSTRWAERLLASGHFVAADLTAALVLDAESLYMIPDRGDRLIATARHLECPLITRDPALARVPGLPTVW